MPEKSAFAITDSRGPAEMVGRECGVALFGEPDGEFLIERSQVPVVRKDQHAGIGGLRRPGEEGRERGVVSPAVSVNGSAVLTAVTAGPKIGGTASVS